MNKKIQEILHIKVPWFYLLLPILIVGLGFVVLGAKSHRFENQSSFNRDIASSVELIYEPAFGFGRYKTISFVDDETVYQKRCSGDDISSVFVNAVSWLLQSRRVMEVCIITYPDGRQIAGKVIPASRSALDADFGQRHIFAGTGITIFYPEAGFYGLGAKVVITEEDDDTVEELNIGTVEEFDATRAAEFVTLHMSIKKTSSIETLEDAVDVIPSSGYYAAEYAEENGKYITVNNYEYFTYRVTESVTAWTALGVHNDFNFSVGLAYPNRDYPESLAAYENNDELFLEILSNIKFE